ncbi:MAG: serine--tRNA ligase, partial [Glaciecola sp.]|nr:serine--tRNA ligase [Glaciecola sp.]
MLDPKFLRDELAQTAQRLATRGYTLDVDAIAAFEAQRKVLQASTQDLQNERNVRSKSIGKAKASGQDIAPLLAEVGELGDKLDAAKAELTELLANIDAITAGIPNLPHESVPVGKDEEDNVEVSRFGTPTTFDFEAKDHVDISAGLSNGLDFDTASKLTGSRFVVMHSHVASMHRALAQFMLDKHTREHGYAEVYVPYLVNSDSLYGTGQLPKFGEDLFHTKPATEEG